MLLQPKRVKYRKTAKGGRVKGQAEGKLEYGDSGLIATENGRVTARQLESARRAIRHQLERKGMVWMRVYPDKGVTKKPTEVRMGKGTGSVAYWSTRVRPGTVLFEITGVTPRVAEKALESAGMKMPMGSKIIMRNGVAS